MAEPNENLLDADASALDAAQATALSAIQRAGASVVELPERYSLEGTFGGSQVDLELNTFRGGPFAWARVTRMRSPGRAQVLNVVAVPAADVAAPCFGAELLVFARGTHLVVLDAWPTHAGTAGLASELKQARAELERDWTLDQVPDWGLEVFTDSAVVVRPGARAGAPASAFTGPFENLFGALTDTDFGRPASPQAHIEGRRKWLRVQGEEEPAREFLTRIAGHAWVKRFTFDVLYPTWLYDGDGTPPWEE